MSNTKKEYDENIGKHSTKIVAHRGLVQLQNAPQENTIKSLIYALHTGADQVEFDVHKTKDDIWVIHHDDKLLNSKERIIDQNYQQLQKYYEAMELELDTLDSFVDRLKQQKLTDKGHILNIELKPQNFDIGREYYQKFKALDLEKIASTSSFSLKSLKGIRTASEDTKISLLRLASSRHIVKYLHKKLHFFSFNPYYRFITFKAITQYQKIGIEVHPWTVDLQEDIQRFLDFNINGIITNKTPLALSLRDSK